MSTHCSKCGAEISKDLKFCPKCGTNQINNCPKCGAKLNKTNNFCTGCGYKLKKPATFISNSLAETKGRLGALLTIWLIILLIVNLVTVISYLLFTSKIASAYPKIPLWGFYLYGLLGLANLVFIVFLSMLKRWAFFAFCWSTIIVVILNLLIGLGSVATIFGLVSLIIIYLMIRSKVDLFKHFRAKPKSYYISLIVVLVVIVLLLIGIFSFSEHVVPKSTAQHIKSTATGTSQKFLTYDNSADGIRIKYPSDWTKNSQIEGAIVVFLSPKKSASDTSATLGVSTEDLSKQPMTLEEYTTLSLKNLNQFVTDAKILDSSATTLDGNSAHKVVYTAKQGQYTLKFMQVYTIKDNTAYVLSYIAEINKFNDFLDTAQEMIDSFKII